MKPEQMLQNDRIISTLLELRGRLKELENIEDSELAKRYQIARLDTEKIIAYFDTFILGSNPNLKKIIF